MLWDVGEYISCPIFLVAIADAKSVSSFNCTPYVFCRCIDTTDAVL